MPDERPNGSVNPATGILEVPELDAPKEASTVLEAINALRAEVLALRKSNEAFANIVARVVFPADAMGDLTEELRAFRHLLDTTGELKFIDRLRDARDKKKRKGGR